MCTVEVNGNTSSSQLQVKVALPPLQVIVAPSPLQVIVALSPMLLLFVLLLPKGRGKI